MEVPPRVELGFALLQSAPFPEGWDRGVLGGNRTPISRLTADGSAIELQGHVEPRDGVDPSELRYKGSAGAGRQGVLHWFGTEVSILVRAGSEPGELAAASRVRFGLEVSNLAGRLQRPAPRRRHPIIDMERAVGVEPT